MTVNFDKLYFYIAEILKRLNNLSFLLIDDVGNQTLILHFINNKKPHNEAFVKTFFSFYFVKSSSRYLVSGQSSSSIKSSSLSQLYLILSKNGFTLLQ